MITTGRECGSAEWINYKGKSITVLLYQGVPTPPGRPIIALSSNRTSECDENTITDEINISWDVPVDDGGYPITGKLSI